MMLGLRTPAACRFRFTIYVTVGDRAAVLERVQQGSVAFVGGDSSTSLEGEGTWSLGWWYSLTRQKVLAAGGIIIGLILTFQLSLGRFTEITIVLCYFHLCSEESGLPLVVESLSNFRLICTLPIPVSLYATFHFFTKMDITNLVFGILYFGYMTIISYAFFVLMGIVDLYTCFWFVQTIYDFVKID